MTWSILQFHETKDQFLCLDQAHCCAAQFDGQYDEEVFVVKLVDYGNDFEVIGTTLCPHSPSEIKNMISQYGGWMYLHSDLSSPGWSGEQIVLTQNINNFTQKGYVCMNKYVPKP